MKQKNTEKNGKYKTNPINNYIKCKWVILIKSRDYQYNQARKKKVSILENK